MMKNNRQGYIFILSLIAVISLLCFLGFGKGTYDTWQEAKSVSAKANSSGSLVDGLKEEEGHIDELTLRIQLHLQAGHLYQRTLFLMLCSAVFLSISMIVSTIALIAFREVQREDMYERDGLAIREIGRLLVQDDLRGVVDYFNSLPRARRLRIRSQVMTIGNTAHQVKNFNDPSMPWNLMN